MGRLFAYGAIARSGGLTLEWTADKNTPYIKEFVGSLVSLAKKKLYLQEPSVSIILELVDKVFNFYKLMNCEFKLSTFTLVIY